MAQDRPGRIDGVAEPADDILEADPVAWPDVQNPGVAVTTTLIDVIGLHPRTPEGAARGHIAAPNLMSGNIREKRVRRTL